MGEKKRKIKRVVLDTNIFISALLFQGQAGRVVELWKQGRIIPLVSEDTLKEIIQVLAYPKFGLKVGEIRSILNEEILPYTESVKIDRVVKGICADAGDDIFLACAVNGKADAIVSGDAHLLNLREFEGIPILKIADLRDG